MNWLEMSVSVLIGFIAGIVTGLFIKYMTRSRYCHGPNSKDIVNTVFYDKNKTGKYWKFTPVITASIYV